jgi:phosphorylcholine metabolism protein LicD
MSEIIIKGFKIKYTPIERFEENSPPMNREILKQDFLELKQIFDKNRLEFLLTAGTLLGAIRENNFIEYDTDVDIICRDEDNLLRIIPQIQEHGFKFIRYQNDPGYITYTFIKSNIHIDVYIAWQIGKYYYLWGGKIKSMFIDKSIKYNFLDEVFLIPKYYKKFLVLLYGKNWMTPVKNKPGPSYINQDKEAAGAVFEFIRKITPQKVRVVMRNLVFIKNIRDYIYGHK